LTAVFFPRAAIKISFAAESPTADEKKKNTFRRLEGPSPPS
jgi:hypothetical protein